MTDHPIPITLAEQARRTGQYARNMAHCIAERRTHLGGCVQADLIRDGWTHTEIARYWTRAKELVGEVVTATPELAALAAFIGFVGCVAVSVGAA